MKYNNFEYTIGNLKIPTNTLIFNLGPAKTCPSRRLGLCQLPKNKVCYALKAEKLYPQVLPFRRRQAKYWNKYNVHHIACDIIGALNKHKKVKYIRINESGDFKDQRDIDRMISIVNTVNSARPDVVFYGYTARKDLDFSARPAALVMSGSGFMLDNNFSAVPEYSKKSIHCPGSCKKCKLCARRGGITIENLYH